MKYEIDSRLTHELEQRLRNKYVTPREDLHLTDLISCLTATYFNKTDPLIHDKQAVMFFAIGFAMENVMLRDIANPNAPESEEVDDIYMTEDYVSLADGMGVDLKTTRMSLNQDTGKPKYGWPDSWMQQFMAYARKRKSLVYSAAVVELIPARLTCITFTFTQAELDENWRYILSRKETYVDAMFSAGGPPQPFKFNQDWECKNRTSTCKYFMRCTQIDKERKLATQVVTL